uniref:Uncharacterized protein n=1 Tax=Oryctolagus cuniculus TaxID=9986 RepID=G1T4E2_RABIT
MEHGSIITQAQREDVLVLTTQGLVFKPSPKKSRGRNIFKALVCCFRAQQVGQSSSSTELTACEEEANTIAESVLLQFDQIPGACLLPEVTQEAQGRIWVDTDLDDTLGHSSSEPINNADFIVPVEMEGTTHRGYMRVPETNGGALPVCSLHCQPGQVHRPCDGPADPLCGAPGAPPPRVLCLLPGLLHQPGKGPENAHPGQLACLLQLPPGERAARAALV